MDWLKGYNKNKKARILVIDSDVLMRLYNNSLSYEDQIEFGSTGIAFEAHLAYTVFTYFEFFKGVKEDSEYIKRLKFLYTKFDACLQYKGIGDDEILNPEYWFEKREFDTNDFKIFLNSIESKIYDFLKEKMIFLAKGVIAISVMIMALLGRINLNCWLAFTEMSKKPEAEKSFNSLLNAVIDANFKNSFFNKKESKKCFDTIVHFGMCLLNVAKEDVCLFTSVTSAEIDEFLKKDDDKCNFVKNQKELNCKSSSTFCYSYLKHINRNNEKGILLTGFYKLTIDYINGRKISTNDLIDFLNINSISNPQENVETFYGTKERYWNIEFFRKFAADEENIGNCMILEWDDLIKEK